MGNSTKPWTSNPPLSSSNSPANTPRRTKSRKNKGSLLGLKLELLVNPTNLPQGQLFSLKASTGSSTLLRGKRLSSSLSLMMSTQLRSLYSSLPSAERWTFPTASSKAKPVSVNSLDARPAHQLLSPMSTKSTLKLFLHWSNQSEPTTTNALMKSDDTGVVDYSAPNLKPNSTRDSRSKLPKRVKRPTLLKVFLVCWFLSVKIKIDLFFLFLKKKKKKKKKK